MLTIGLCVLLRNISGWCPLLMGLRAHSHTHYYCFTHKGPHEKLYGNCGKREMVCAAYEVWVRLDCRSVLCAFRISTACVTR